MDVWLSIRVGHCGELGEGRGMGVRWGYGARRLNKKKDVLML